MPLSVQAQEAGTRYALLIAGLGGDAEHTEKFKGYLFETRKAFLGHFGFEEGNVIVLGEAKIQEEAFVDALSNADNIRAQFDALSAKVTPDDDVYVILFGHGGYEGGEARLNIPRRDLSQHDFAGLVGQLNPRRLVFINTASSSAPFVEALTGEGRIVITATRSGTQNNETTFPRFMVASFTDPGTDQDKNGRISVGEIFTFTAEKTTQWFDDNNNVPTEQALIADTGEAKGYRLREMEEAGAGQLAALTYLSQGESELLASSGDASPELTSWLREKNQIELDIAELKSQKAEMNLEDYYVALEMLFIRLAQGNDRAEALP